MESFQLWNQLDLGDSLVSDSDLSHSRAAPKVSDAATRDPNTSRQMNSQHTARLFSSAVHYGAIRERRLRSCKE